MRSYNILLRLLIVSQLIGFITSASETNPIGGTGVEDCCKLISVSGTKVPTEKVGEYEFLRKDSKKPNEACFNNCVYKKKHSTDITDDEYCFEISSVDSKCSMPGSDIMN